MGIFGRQWLLRIRICCHDSEYLTDSGSKNSKKLHSHHNYNLLDQSSKLPTSCLKRVFIKILNKNKSQQVSTKIMQQGASLKTSVIYAFIRPLVDNHYCCIVSDGSKVKSNFEVSLHSSHDNLKDFATSSLLQLITIVENESRNNSYTPMTYQQLCSFDYTVNDNFPQ